MPKEKSIIISSNLESPNNEVESLFANSSYRCIFVSQDGKDLCESIHKENPDVVLMNIFMPNLDAIGVMDTINNDTELPQKPIFIIMSTFNSPIIEKELFAHGATYLFLYPIILNMLVERIVQLTNNDKSINLPMKYDLLYDAISNVLKKIKLPRHINGYNYVRDSIYLTINDPSIMNSVLKRLYPAIANLHNTSASRVERAIRHTVEVTWGRGDKQILEQYFGYSPDDECGRPTNSEFIITLSDIVEKNNSQ